MAAKKTSTALVSAPSEDALAALRNQFPVEQGFQSIQLPRIAFKSQDVTEGKGKDLKVTIEAGTFLTEMQGDDIDPETGKKAWVKEEIGSTFEGTIVYKRKQLRLYDEVAQKYASTPIYDEDTEVIPLFQDKVEIARGTAKDLQAKYMGVDRNGKPKSKLEENVILYILKDDELYQMNLRGSSMYNFKTFARKTLVPAVLTRFSSEEKENGSVSWNAMTFTPVRQLYAEEVQTVLAQQQELAQGVAMQKASFASATTPDTDDFGDPLNA